MTGYDLECLVIGAGVIGLAVARALALAGREVVIVESEGAYGTATSSRNSEVIHAGLYYTPDSLRARLCVSGRDALYDYCQRRAVPFLPCGKLVVATEPAEVGTLRAIQARARRNGVGDVYRVDAAGARAIEPAVRCVEALVSPSSGVVDSHGLMSALLADARAAGAALALQSPVLSARGLSSGGAAVRVGGSEPMDIRCASVVNSAGLGAWAVARSFSDVMDAHVPDRYLAKGTYFSVRGGAPFNGLVYPLPNPASLGVHSCLDLGGVTRFGPDLEWVDEVSYAVDPARAACLYEPIRRWYPDLANGTLEATYAGIRPKVQAPGQPPADWDIRVAHPGVIHLLGMESPGLTSCLAIADHVVARLDYSLFSGQ